ncbi:MAG TPA: ATP-binding cassette domain-containing protein, partial [Steroidobacteraceae bacterium]|nr:ATP-binding cassette domain-containing protein [Steroidobacteraceae bacterium]
MSVPAAALSVKRLHAGYEKHVVLTDVNLSVAQGEWVALLGPNASGKSTLLHCVVGTLTPTSGEIVIYGASLLT